MGQKVNPTGFRIANTKDWRASWFDSSEQYSKKVSEDIQIRNFLKKSLKNAAVGRINIERLGTKLRIVIFSAKPGLVIGKRGKDIEMLKKKISKLLDHKEIIIDTVEIKNAELNAKLVAESIALQLQRRIAFRRAMKKALYLAMDLGAEGIKIQCSGRLGDAELARTEQYHEGKVPLQTMRANIDYGFAEALTGSGIIGIKVWICKSSGLEKTNTTLG